MGTFFVDADLNALDGGPSATTKITVGSVGIDDTGATVGVQVTGPGGVIFDRETDFPIAAGIMHIELPDNTNTPADFGYRITRPRTDGQTQVWLVPAQPTGTTVQLGNFTPPVSSLPMLPSEYELAVLAIAAEEDRATNSEEANQAAIDAEADRAGDAEALLAPKASPVLTGNPTAPTQPAGTNNTRVATTAYADAAVTLEAAARAAAIATLTGGAPPELDQFIEAYNRFLADESAAAATNAALATKVPMSRLLAGLDLSADRSAQAIVDALATPLAASTEAAIAAYLAAHGIDNPAGIAAGLAIVFGGI